MSSVNKIILLGRIGKDPETRFLDGGQQVTKLTLATSEKYKKNGETIEETEWHNLIFWGKLSEIVDQYCKKGGQIYVEGKQTHRKYEKDGEVKYYSEVIVRELKLLGNKGDNQNDSPLQPQGDSGDLPF